MCPRIIDLTDPPFTGDLGTGNGRKSVFVAIAVHSARFGKRLGRCRVAMPSAPVRRCTLKSSCPRTTFIARDAFAPRSTPLPVLVRFLTVSSSRGGTANSARRNRTGAATRRAVFARSIVAPKSRDRLYESATYFEYLYTVRSGAVRSV